MTTGRSITDIIERRHRERTVEGERFVPIAMTFVLDGEVVLRVGGRWDRRADDYDQPAAPGMPGAVVRIHPGQEAAVRWFGEWLESHVERRVAAEAEHGPRRELLDLEETPVEVEIDLDPAHAYAALFAGGRRAGKTWIAVELAVAYAVAVPRAIVWLVSPTDTTDGELVRYVRAALPKAWIDRETGEGWELCNGSQLLLLSAYNPEGLKQGEAHLVVLNEGQRMHHRAYTLARGAVVDHAGLVIVCANPPVEAKDQQWVVDFAAEAQAGRRQALYLHFDARKNPHIDVQALYALAAELDERTAAIEVWGEFRAAADAVAYNWVRLENEKPPPIGEMPDVTEAFLAGIEEGTGILQVVGLDVQRIPYIGGPVFRFFGSPNRDEVLAWIVDEIVLDGGDEVDFCAALELAGYAPDQTLIVCDATAEYQHSRRRNTDQPPPEWQGRGSWSIIKQEGYRRIVAPDRKMRRKNPAIQDRVRAFTSLICSDGVRRLFADPIAAPRSCKAIREWKQQHGTAHRTQYEAHLGDGISYPVIRFFPRRAIAALTNEPRSQNQRAAMRPGIANPTPSTQVARGAIQMRDFGLRGPDRGKSPRGTRRSGL